LGFDNEATWLRAVRSGTEEEYHGSYEKAVEALRSEFGEEHSNCVDGREIRSTAGTFDDTSPADLDLLLGKFQKGTAEDAKAAVEAAWRAFPSWSSTSWEDRADIFRKAGDLMARDKWRLAALMSYENGKNRHEAIGDVDEAIDMLRFYAYQLEVNEGFERTMGQCLDGEVAKSVLRPYGVWAVISPFNFPVAITTGMTAAALITGNAAILKPASDTPWTGKRVYEILIDAGVPPGALNFVAGPGSGVGAELVRNPRVSGLVFTGSREVGMGAFKEFTSGQPRPIITELGGKNPVIVTENADLEKAVEGTVKAAFGYGGQKCSAASRLLVQESIADEFIPRVAEATEELVVGFPTERDVYMGPVVNRSAYEKFQEVAAKSREDGEVLAGGEVVEEGLPRGYYVRPTLVDALPADHEYLREELFLPVLCARRFSDLEEALRIANEVDYGLTAGIFTEDEAERDAFFRDIQAGVVYCNRRVGATTGAVVGVQPFVGWKMSGISGKGAGGPYYLQQFMREQSRTYYV
jgi:1-pyrroline-5-carboxylate dehydrogenase